MESHSVLKDFKQILRAYTNSGYMSQKKSIITHWIDKIVDCDVIFATGSASSCVEGIMLSSDGI